MKYYNIKLRNLILKLTLYRVIHREDRLHIGIEKHNI